MIFRIKEYFIEIKKGEEVQNTWAVNDYQQDFSTLEQLATFIEIVERVKFRWFFENNVLFGGRTLNGKDIEIEVHIKKYEEQTKMITLEDLEFLGGE